MGVIRATPLLVLSSTMWHITTTEIFFKCSHYTRKAAVARYRNTNKHLDLLDHQQQQKNPAPGDRHSKF